MSVNTLKFADFVTEITSQSSSNKEALNKEIVIIDGLKKRTIKSFIHKGSKMIIKLGDK